MNTISKTILSVAALAATTMTVSAEVEPIDLYPDTWVAIDGIDRVLPTAEDQPLKTDKERIVCIFYVSWHYDWFYTNFKSPYACDVTKILNEDPSARLDYNHHLWTHEFAYHWGEPEMGYFTSCDPYVIRKDMSMLTDAGVDLLVLDCTNAVCYFDEWDALFRVMEQLKEEGQKVPKICFWGFNGTVAESLGNIYTYYYKKDKYRDLWYFLDGKPLMLYNEEATYSQEFLDFFTFRNMWWGYFNWNGHRYLGTEDRWCFGYDMHDTSVAAATPEQRASTHNGCREQMCVTPAQHASTMVGKSWTLKQKEPQLNDHDLPLKKFLNKKWIDHPEYYGFYFKERWDEALSVDPDYIYLNDWNEWIAGQFAADNVSFMGRNSNFQFVDQYNAEFNRTIQPMKGGGTDNYYMQMIDGIRRYKGVREAPLTITMADVTIDSDFDRWQAIDAEYFDTPGDVLHRNYTGYGGNRYKDESGRNDILRSKVNVGEDNVTFYVTTASDLTPYTDPNWMLLLINSDCDYTTGWHGFDYLVNKEFESDNTSVVMSWNNETSQWEKCGTARFRAEGTNLALEMPLATIGITDGNAGNFYFKWADNPADLDDPISLCINGDTAPNRRFCYNYRWDYGSSGLEKLEQQPAARLKVTPLTGHTLFIETTGSYIVADMMGRVMATGSGTSTAVMPSTGIYVVKSGSDAIKVIL
ncbi:MAG: hypothetical protein NC098_03920 [Lachnoclostridium sp.]|nr:hypothetical protein [Lachnoclostridium sp.]